MIITVERLNYGPLKQEKNITCLADGTGEEEAENDFAK